MNDTKKLFEIFSASTSTRQERRGNQWYTVTYENGMETACEPFSGDGKPGSEPTISVWRIENQYNAGPYAQSGQGNIHALLHEIEDGRYVKKPLPNNDPNLALTFEFFGSNEFLSGFASLQSHLNWFDTKKIRDTLAEHGFSLNEYRVPQSNVMQGQHQVLFRPQGSIIINSMAPNSEIVENTIDQPVAESRKPDTSPPVLTMTKNLG